MPETAAGKPAIENRAQLARIRMLPKNRLGPCKQALSYEIIVEAETPRRLPALLPNLQKILVLGRCEITAHRGRLLGTHAAITAGANNICSDFKRDRGDLSFTFSVVRCVGR